MSGGGAGTERPLCRCHGEPMTRRNDTPRGWRCSVSHRVALQKDYAANAPARNYGDWRRRLRARIERKRQQIEALERRLAEENVS